MRRQMAGLCAVILCGVLVLTACGAEGGGARATAPASGASGGAAGGAAPGGTATTVNVVGTDFKFALDKTSVPAGAVTFTFKNDGPSPHNFIIIAGGREQASMLIDAGRTATLTANLTPGSYRYICNVAGHEQLGMVGMLTVT